MFLRNCPAEAQVFQERSALVVRSTQEDEGPGFLDFLDPVPEN